MLGTILLGVTFLLPQDIQLSIPQEGSVVETTTAICLALSGVLILWLRPLIEWLHLSAMCFLLCEREFDAKILEPGSALREQITWIDDIFLHNRIVIAVLGLWLLISLGRFTVPWLWRHVRRRTPVFAAVSIATGCVVLSQSIELVLKAYATPETPLAALHACEEVLEFYFAATILLMVMVALRDRHWAR